MKQLIFFFAFATLFACSEQQEVVQTNSDQIELVSLEGVSLSTSVKALKNELEENIWSILGKEEAFEIIGVDYIESRTETLALVEYKTISGFTSNLGLSIDRTDLREKIKYKVTCEGDCGCRVQGSIGADGTVGFSCACDDCSLFIESIK